MKMSNVKSVLNDIKRLKQLKPGVNTGPIAARLQQFGQVFGIRQASDDFIQLRTVSTNLVANYLKSISGAQVSDKEAKRLANVIPRITDDDNEFNAKLKEFERLVKIGGNEFLNAVATGQPLRQELAIQLASQIDVTVATTQQIKNDMSFEKKLDAVLNIKQAELQSKGN